MNIRSLLTLLLCLSTPLTVSAQTPTEPPPDPPTTTVPDEPPTTTPGDPPDSAPGEVPEFFSFLENVSSIATTGVSATDDIRVGFILEGTGTVNMVLRGRAQSLNFQSEEKQNSRLENPGLRVLNQSTGAELLTADDYTNEDLSILAGDPKYIPGNVAPTDAIAILEGGAGGYTITIPSDSGESGLAIGESIIFYGDTSPETATIQLGNVSTFAQTSPEAPLFVGFIVTGNAQVNLVCRGSGPSVAPNNPNLTRIADPVITLFRQSDGTVIGTNDDYQDGDNLDLITGTSFIQGGITAQDSILTLLNVEPGGYTLQVTDANGGTGICLGEIFLAEF